MCNDNRKIMTYPFTGLDYEDIKEIADRVRFNKEEVRYIIPYIDSRYGMKQEKTVIVNDEKVKYTLNYFRFLGDMCRVRQTSDEYKTFSINTYIDTILITLNEIVACSKMYGCSPDFNELLGRFGKKYDKDDLFKLYSSPCEYYYLNNLFDFLSNDSYFENPSNGYRINDGVYFDMIQNGMVKDIVNSIITNKDNIDELNFSNVQTSGPKLTKKISNFQDYRVSIY